MVESKDEYTALRGEITARAVLIHQLLALAAFMLLLAGTFGFYLYTQGYLALLESYILFLPIVFAGLTFGYQANQMTLEAVAYYLRDHSPAKEVTANWENFYGQIKRSVQLISFLKVLPLLLPLFIPVFYLACVNQWPDGLFDGYLLSFDLALLLLALFNFRYKLKK